MREDVRLVLGCLRLFLLWTTLFSTDTNRNNCWPRFASSWVGDIYYAFTIHFIVRDSSREGNSASGGVKKKKSLFIYNTIDVNMDYKLRI